MSKAVEMSGRDSTLNQAFKPIYRQCYLASHARSRRFEPCIAQISPRRSLEEEANSDAPKCTTKTCFVYEFEYELNLKFQAS
jgi:hypothetical protein